MKTKITLLALLVMPYLGFSQSACDKYKNGTFKVTDPQSKKVCIITRDGDKQTERMEESDDTYDFDIVWIDDCTYTVTPTAASAAKNKDVLKAGTMTVKLTKIKDSSYTQRVTVANNPKFRRMDEVFLVKEDKKE